MYPHLISVIFRSDGMEAFGVFSMAVSYPFPNVDSGANAPAANALFFKKERREFEFDIVLVVGWMLPGSCFKEFLDLFFGYGQFVDMVVQPFGKIFFNLIGPAIIDLARCVFLFAQPLMTKHIAQPYDF